MTIRPHGQDPRPAAARKAADAAIAATKTALIEQARGHDRHVVLVDPKQTTTDCAQCGARTKPRPPLSEHTSTCQQCGTTRPRDKNCAPVILDRAGLHPAGADRTRPDRQPGGQAA